MAQALSSSFDEWIRSLLNDLQSNDVDMSDFVQYLTGIVMSDSETDEEKQTAIAELLADLELKVSLSNSLCISTRTALLLARPSYWWAQPTDSRSLVHVAEWSEPSLRPLQKPSR